MEKDDGIDVDKIVNGIREESGTKKAGEDLTKRKKYTREKNKVWNEVYMSTLVKPTQGKSREDLKAEWLMKQIAAMEKPKQEKRGRKKAKLNGDHEGSVGGEDKNLLETKSEPNDDDKTPSVMAEERQPSSPISTNQNTGKSPTRKEPSAIPFDFQLKPAQSVFEPAPTTMLIEKQTSAPSAPAKEVPLISSQSQTNPIPTTLPATAITPAGGNPTPSSNPKAPEKTNPKENTKEPKESTKGSNKLAQFKYDSEFINRGFDFKAHRSLLAYLHEYEKNEQRKASLKESDEYVKKFMEDNASRAENSVVVIQTGGNFEDVRKKYQAFYDAVSTNKPANGGEKTGAMIIEEIGSSTQRYNSHMTKLAALGLTSQDKSAKPK